MFDDDTNRSYISRDQIEKICIALSVFPTWDSGMTDNEKADAIDMVMIEVDYECDVATSVDFEDFCEVLVKRSDKIMTDQILQLKKRLDNGEDILASSASIAAAAGDGGGSDGEVSETGSGQPVAWDEHLSSYGMDSGKSGSSPSAGSLRRSQSISGAGAAAAAAASSASASFPPPGTADTNNTSSNRAGTAGTSTTKDSDAAAWRGIPHRCLSGRDSNIRITKEDLDEAYAWITAKCAGGRLTDRGLKEQLHSVFGANLRWTRKELLMLAHDPDMTADRLWNLLPHTPLCATYDTVGEVFGMFDRDGDGVVDDEVLRAMWVELYKESPMADKLPEGHDKVIDEKVRSMYHHIADYDGDSIVTLEDFRRYAKKHKGILD